MAEKLPESSADIARQLAQHLASLQGAGIEWLPSAPLPEVRPAPAPGVVKQMALPTVRPSLEAPTSSTAASDPVTVQTSLFAGVASEAGPPSDIEVRRQALADLARQVSQCVRCQELASTRTQTVFGVGPLDPELCFVGEAPGADEDRL